jgi:hypothetical protein
VVQDVLRDPDLQRPAVLEGVRETGGKKVEQAVNRPAVGVLHVASPWDADAARARLVAHPLRLLSLREPLARIVATPLSAQALSVLLRRMVSMRRRALSLLLVLVYPSLMLSCSLSFRIAFARLAFQIFLERSTRCASVHFVHQN